VKNAIGLVLGKDRSLSVIRIVELWRFLRFVLLYFFSCCIAVGCYSIEVSNFRLVMSVYVYDIQFAFNEITK